MSQNTNSFYFSFVLQVGLLSNFILSFVTPYKGWSFIHYYRNTKGVLLIN